LKISYKMLLCFRCAGRIVAITRDCKSCGFGLRGFESLPAHKNKTLLGRFYFCAPERVPVSTRVRDSKGFAVYVPSTACRKSPFYFSGSVDELKSKKRCEAVPRRRTQTLGWDPKFVSWMVPKERLRCDRVPPLGRGC
jgi:hypothetical protein